MKIDHIAIWTLDLENLKSFYQTYFNCMASEKYINQVKGFSSYFLSFEGETRIEIMNIIDLQDKTTIEKCCGLAHLAISVNTRADVDILTNRIVNDGFRVVGNPRTTGDGYYESVILDPDGNIVEIVAK